jgi:hypothetical protein
MTHEEHLAQIEKDAALKKRGAAAMGFDQETTTHHFLLTADGGAIEVGVNAASDAVNRDVIRSHLKERDRRRVRPWRLREAVRHPRRDPAGSEDHAAARDRRSVILIR